MLTLKQLTLCTTLILAGCTSLAPDHQRPESPVPQQFSRSHNGLVPVTAGYQNTGWRNFFSDHKVQTLISDALRYNRDVRMAALNVQEARARYNVTDADRYPQLNAKSGLDWQSGLNSQRGTSREYSAGGELSFELDFFGRLKNMSEAERQNFFASEETQRAVHILLVADVSQRYFSQRLADGQLSIAREALKNYQQSYAFVGQQLITGSTTLLAVEQARGAIESTQAEIAKREGEQALANSALQLVVGRYSEAARQAPAEQALNPVKLPANLSSDILLQRPDILAAEHQLQAAEANIGAARAAFFPSISLTGGIEATSPQLSDLFTAGSGLWRFAPRIDIPLFNAGRNRANLTLAEVRQQQSVVTYEQKIQNAFKEVADALAQRESLSGQLAAQQRYLDSLNITLLRAKGLYASGSVSYIEVLDAERSLFATRQNILDLIYARDVNEVALFTALGGGWAE
ncbi:Cu(I)/Ag(I) efflux RND transporter outer membrane protein [Erwinia sorbitola]|uniref:Efflux transporter outer membrane subunit n=1 Tax=Erwinia sorbitola TaxID=2681984 RepID=A0A6I6F1X8_9GAMM|nr:Cu(I)/Ag(I) efflux RND transporter outer membrane protein [Erwinia sorbitola]MTD25528.1 efflux transporter outer membrane subunit [Erwinia sorbitola]QGU87910.1 efflux transporter outer membrane subunit [Erwinia sorbitola]